MAERWNVGVGGVIGAVAGGVSAAAASLIGGGDSFIAGTAVGVGGGAVIASALFWAIRDQGELGASTARVENPPVGAASAHPTATATPVSRADTSNLAPLVQALGGRFESLAQRQLDAVEALAATLGNVDRDDAGELAAARRLARRSRRTAATLRVLADPDATTVARPDHSVAALLHEALADSEDRDRIDVSSVHDATLSGEVVQDVVHILAELIENAAAASHEPVVVFGRRSADGYVLSVVDEGTGLTPPAREDANATLSSPPGLDRQPPAALGLSVVGRLAARHGIRVQLLESATDGVIAKVRVPQRLLDGGWHEVSSPFERALEALAAGDDSMASAVPSTGASHDEDTFGTVIDLTEPIEAPAGSCSSPAEAGFEPAGNHEDEAASFEDHATIFDPDPATEPERDGADAPLAAATVAVADSADAPAGSPPPEPAARVRPNAALGRRKR